MRKVSILSLHLGYGGIEKSIAALANILAPKYNVEIACIYKLQEKSAFEFDKRVKIKYLINTDIPVKVQSYKVLLQRGEYGKVFKKLWNNYFKKLKFISFFKNTFGVISIYIKRNLLMKKYLKKTDADIIISTRTFLNELSSNYAPSKAFKIGWEHNHYHGNMKYAVDVIRSVKKLNYFVLVSNNLYNFYSEKLKDTNCKCIFIPNVLDGDVLKKAPLNEERLISVGRLSKEKGQLDLLKIYNIISNDYPTWHLDIIGDGPERESLEEYIDSHNLKDKVTLHGFRDKKYIDNMLDKSSIYLMSSYTESFGIVLIEAMSHGVPCIAFDSAEGACELISSGRNGYLIKNRNFYAYIKKVEDLIDRKEERMALGSEAFETSKKYTSKKVATYWFDLLEKSDKND